jgi:LmbE family N-acetylglucosaminyl deacetylase
MTYTVVCFHAHPDDEALLTGGTMARLAAQGHRVVLVVATAGEAGLTSASLSASGALGDLRLAELSRSAEILGCARVVNLGYADSGMDGRAQSAGQRFCTAAVDDAASRLLAVLREETADVLTIYDSAGGYGHPDHVQVHRVGVRAAELAATPVVLEATIDRRALQRALRVVGWFTPGAPGFQPSRFAHAYADPELITHRVNVRPYWRQKRSALQAHATQAQADDGDRTLAWILRLPTLLFRLAFGHEWFLEHTRRPAQPLLDDVLHTLRSQGRHLR